jgi:hypothetical protein
MTRSSGVFAATGARAWVLGLVTLCIPACQAGGGRGADAGVATPRLDAVPVDVAPASADLAADLAPPSPDLAPASPDLAPPSVDCSDYCGAIARTCSDRAQYDSQASCLAYCRFMPEGSTATPNTVACRREALARFDLARPTTSCLAAGPGGELAHQHACGSPCSTFCGMALRICPEAFPDLSHCMNACAAFPDRPVYALPNVDRNTYGCRLYYLTQAALRADLHCPKVTAGSPVCR